MPLKRYIYLLLFSSLIITAQQSIIKKYTTLEGLPDSKIYDCTQSEDGNMWFAAEGGLIEYDGTHWTHYDSLNGMSVNLSFGFIQFDDNNTLWAVPKLATDRIWYRENNSWNFLNPIKDNYLNFISYDIINRNNSATQLLLITHTSKVFIVSKDSVYNLSNPFLNKRKIYCGRFVNEQLLFGTDDGIYKYDMNSNDIKVIPSTSGHKIYTMEYDSSTNEFYYLSNSHIGILRDNKLKTIKFNFDLYFDRDDYVPSFIKIIPNGDIYFGTIFALYCYNQFTGTINELNVSNGYTTAGASSIFIDYEQNIWLTTFRGINKIRNTTFLSFNRSDFLLEDEVTSISKFPNGPIVFAHNTGFTCWDGKNVVEIPFNKKITENFSRVQNMAYDSTKNIIWFTAQKSGLGYITRDLKFHWKISVEDTSSISFISISTPSNEVLYYSSSLGLFSLSKNISKQLVSSRSLNIRRIINYNDSSIIAASKKGLVIYNKYEGKYKVISTDDIPKNNLYDIFKLNDNEWLVASLNGLLLFDGKHLIDYDKLSISKSIFFIRAENRYVWFGLMGGAIRWNRDTGESIFFDANDGLLGVETNRDAFLFSDGVVYIGTDKSLSIFQSNRYEKDSHFIKPKIHFDGYKDLKGNFYSITESNSFSFTNNLLILQYNSPSFIDESATKYSIIIENLDDDISEIHTTSSTDYEIRNLTPGTYKIGIFATNVNDVSSDTLYSERITFHPPFYLESWFIIMMVILSISASISLYDYINKSRYSKQLELQVAERTKQLKESEKNIRDLTQRIFKAQEEQRERIARDLHDNIAQDMAMIKIEIEKFLKESGQQNPHNNWLTNKVTELTKYLRDMSYFLHPNAIKQTGFINAVQSLCNNFIVHSKIEIEFFSNLEDSFELHQEASTNIYRFIQEALTNIRKHSNANNGIVILVKRDDLLVIRIEDDGIGFNMEKIIQSKTKRSMGLQSMEERIIYVGGKLKIKSSPNEGTHLSAEIPLYALNHFKSFTNSDQDSGS